MASVFTGYEYDIFISYRQKDNKGDKWVNEFVEALKVELDSTFKEDISIYYDENPHDGLLETHDVDGSLKEKLRCIVFIPIVSRTYCDPKSFAWEHEFRTFVELASNDKLGLKIKLPSGNVASRVLPVRIHELEPEDHKLCESVLGGVLRGVDFIFKSPGVNRPLRINEDYPQSNLNKTNYRDQINKVANALDEIFHAIRNPEALSEIKGEMKNEPAKKERPGEGRKMRFSLFSKKSVRRTFLFLAFIVCAAGAIITYNILDSSEIRKSVAILPFRCAANDPALITSGDILTELALSKLQNIKELTIRSRISTIPYRNTQKNLNMIRKELDVNYIVDGTVRSDSNMTMIWISLVDARHDKQLWSKEYLWDNNQFSATVSEIAREIASKCKVELTSEDLKQIDSSPTSSSKAYLSFLSANVTYNDAWNFFNTGANLVDTNDNRKAVREYDRAIRYDSLFAEAYARRAIAISWGFFIKQFDSAYIEKCHKDISRALELNPDIPEALVALGCYYYFCKSDYEKALVYFNRTAVQNPSNYQPLFYLALVYRRLGDWGKSQSLISRVVHQNPQVPLFLTNIGLSYDYLHKFDSAIIYHQKAIDVNPNWSAPYFNKVESIILREGKTKEARRVIQEAEDKTDYNFTVLKIRMDLYDGKLKDALKKAEDAYHVGFESELERYLTFATVFRLMNDRDKSIEYYDSALAAIPVRQNDYNMHSKAALAYAGIGMREKALEQANLSIELSEDNKMDQSDMKLNQAKVYTMLGDFDNAIMNIEYLLENPSAFSIELLKLDPVWTPLLINPHVVALTEKYSFN